MLTIIAARNAKPTLVLYQPDLPWELFLVGLSTLLLGMSGRLGISPRIQDMLCVALLVIAAFHMIDVAWVKDPSQIFAAYKKLFVAACLVGSSVVASKRGLTMGPYLAWVGGIWGACTLALDILTHLSPTSLSFLCALCGAGGMIWGHYAGSRRIWVMGGVTMGAAAVKLVLFDFGSLGELKNIFAMIATGCIFLVVSWIVPYPPTAKDSGLSKDEETA